MPQKFFIFRISSFLIFLSLLFFSSLSLVFSQSLEDKVVEYNLNNGMRFLLLKRSEAPVFSSMIRFIAGGVDEHSGISGIAHLFEHMAFKGTTVIGSKDYSKERIILDEIERVGDEITAESIKTVGKNSAKIDVLRKKLERLENEHRQFIKKDEFDLIYTINGAEGLNASTSKDFTYYYVSLPSNRLELWMYMESERLRVPVFREFFRERDVVAEERRMRTETNPGGKLYEGFLATAFQAHPYGIPTIGWMSDINSLTIKKAREFYNKYYSPVNAVGAIVGDIDIEKTKSLLNKYFGRLPKKTSPEPVITVEPEQIGERRSTVVLDAEPDIIIGYHKPTFPSREYYIFNVIDALLSRGRTSRLYKHLIKDAQTASEVWTDSNIPGTRYDNLFVISATPIYPHSTAEIETAVEIEINKLKTEPVSDKELQKILNRLEADFLWNLKSNMGLASELTYYEGITGDWRYILKIIEEYKKVSKEEIIRVAKKYFTVENKIVTTIVKK